MAAELETRLVSALTQIGTDIGVNITKIGDLTTLSTTAKGNLVAAINETFAAVGGGGVTNLSLANRGATTLDILSDTGTDVTVPAATTTLTGLQSGADKLKLDGIATGATANSTNAVLLARANHTGTQTSSTISDFTSAVNALINGVIDGAPVALDTLNELAAALGDDPNFATTITTALNNRVRFDAAQTLTLIQRQQACANIGVGDPDRNLSLVYTTARDA